MDRRRFVPASEGLETRNLLSAASAAAANTAAVTSAATTTGSQVDGNSAVAETIQTKFQRIQNLPFFLGRLTKGNALPGEAVAEIQGALRSNVASLHASSSDLVRKFNVDIRRVLTNENIRPTDAATLNNDFDAVLQGAGASPESRARLRDGMSQLTQFDSTQRTSAIVVANHYAEVLQVALGSGRPLVSPAKPRLVAGDRSTSHGMDLTKKVEPSFTGSYAEGAQVQIVDINGKVLGTSATIDKTGNYTVTLDQPLAEGKHTVFARATDSTYSSELSKPYNFTVKVPVVVVKALHPTGRR